jgi:hypothetical protein
MSIQVADEALNKQLYIPYLEMPRPKCNPKGRAKLSSYDIQLPMLLSRTSFKWMVVDAV